MDNSELFYDEWTWLKVLLAFNDPDPDDKVVITQFNQSLQSSASDKTVVQPYTRAAKALAIFYLQVNVIQVLSNLWDY